MSVRPMRHDEAWESLPAAALGALDSVDDPALLAHLDACPTCRNELDTMREAASTLALASGASPLPDERKAVLRARLLHRARAEKQRPLPTPRRAARTLNPLEWVGIAAGLLFVTSGAGNAVLMHERAMLRAALDTANHQMVTEELGLDSMHTVVEERDALLAGLTGKDMAMVRLTSAAKRQAWALMFWNRQTNVWTFLAHSLPMPRPGRTYQLWLVTANAKISAGTFMPHTNGDAMMHTMHPLDRSALKAVAVTEEPAGGMPQPTGPFVVVGTESPGPR